MNEREWLATQFEDNRSHLRAVAYRMLGSLSEADDAVQEAWLRLSRSGSEGIENLGGWLTTVVSHVCLDLLRSRASRREESLSERVPEPPAKSQSAPDPEQEALLADSVGLALLVVLDRLEPAERLAFVLHDMFAVPFEEIAGIVGRSPAAARQLASRARRRVRGASGVSGVSGDSLSQQREVAAAFLAALRSGDFEALLAVLDPDLVVHADAAAAGGAAGVRGTPSEVHGAEFWARQAMLYSRGARFVQLALINGGVGLVLAPRGKLSRALRFTFGPGNKIVGIDIIGEPASLRALDLATLAE